jgi:hypothetical protein
LTVPVVIRCFLLGGTDVPVRFALGETREGKEALWSPCKPSNGN